MHDSTIRHLALPALTLLVLPAACYSPTDAVTGANAEDAGASEDSGTSASSGSDTSASSGGPTTADTGIETDAVDDTTAGTTPVCGNGMVEGDEVCDDGENDGSYDGCTADCTALGPHCGDGIEQGEESCDDGDETNGNGCNNDCVVSGTVLWTQYHGTSESFTGVSVAPNDAIIAVGVRRMDDERRVMIEKWSPEGDSVWLQTYSGPSGDYATTLAVATDDSGNAYLSGGYGTYTSPTAFVRKYDSNGNVIYTKTNDTATNSSSAGLGAAVSADGYAVLSGYEVHASDMLQRGWIQRLDLAGDELWSREYLDGASSATADAVAVGPSGEIVVAGRLVDGDAGDLWLRKYTQEGTSVWTRTYDDGGRERSYSVDTDQNGNVVVAGNGGDGAADGEIILLLYDADGTLQWSTEVPLGFSSAEASFDSDSNVILAGRGSEDNGGHELSVINKYGFSGTLLWEQQWIDIQGIYGDDLVYTDAGGIAVDSSDGIVVVGSEFGSDGTVAWIRKIAP